MMPVLDMDGHNDNLGQKTGDQKPKKGKLVDNRGRRNCLILENPYSSSMSRGILTHHHMWPLP
jgi:hypothetical protein